MAVLLALASAGGCGTAASRATRDRHAVMSHVLDESKDGSTIDLHTGESVVIILPENATTGYRWEVGRLDRDVVGFVAEESRYPTGPMVGSGGHVEFLFQALKPGRSDILLRQLRPWEGDASVIGRYRLHVNVLP